MAIDEPTADRDLVIRRVFSAPRERVFRAWTDPGTIRSWLGPRGYTAIHFEQDLRPGGAWRACLRPDAGGDDLWQGGVCRAVVPPERLSFTFAWDGKDGKPGHETLVDITFADLGGQTEMTFRQTTFKTVESRDGHRSGWGSSFDRLEEQLSAAG